MRYVCALIATLIVSIVIPLRVAGQGPEGLSIGNYQFISEQRITRSESFVTYRADLVNLGPARGVLTATVSSKVVSTKVAAGAGTLQFGSVAANSETTSLNTFTLRVDRTVPFKFTDLEWTFSAPVADAGLDQTVPVGATVKLDGSGSTNPSGQGSLTYRWKLFAIPAGSHATVSDPTAISPTFVVDAPGVYVPTVTVSNGISSDTGSVTISTYNSTPVAVAGSNQSYPVGTNVILDGSRSYDVDGDSLNYSWTMAARPDQSTAALSNPRSVSPSFVADKAGTYVLQLNVSDGRLFSTPSTVTINTNNTAPVANAGRAQITQVNDLVELDGSNSTDVDGDSLSYQWTLLSKPSGSSAALLNQHSVQAMLGIDQAGTYVAQLIVNDGEYDSKPSTVIVTTENVPAPVAQAGPNRTVKHGETVVLEGRGVDRQSLPLTYKWSLVAKPESSSASLDHAADHAAAKASIRAAASNTETSAKFIADQPGVYVGQLVVSNGLRDSAPATVTVTTTNSKPVANAGPNQSVAVGSIVTLDGHASTDADNDPLRYTWSFLSRAPGSAASLSGASSPAPTFFADAAGVYVIQLVVNDGFTNSDPATVQVTVTANAIVLTPDPLNLFNSPGALGITLPSPAPAGGTVVRLASLDPSVATVPATVTVPENTRSAVANVTPVAKGSTLVTASVPGIRPGSATVNVGTPALTLSLSSATVGLTRTMNGRVILSVPAPAGGVFVALTANPSGIVSLQPTSVNIPEGSSEGAFTVTGVAEGSTVIGATSPGYTGVGTPVTVGRLGLIVLQSGVTVPPGQSAPMQVSLATPAPVGGVVVTLSSSDTTKATITPSTITIPQGATTPGTPPVVNGIAFGTAVISASAPGLTGASQSVQVAAILAFVPDTLTVGSGSPKNITLTLSGPAPAGGLNISLTSSRSDIASVPPTATIAANATSVTVPVTGVAPGNAVINASAGPNVSIATANITVVLFGTINAPGLLNVALGQTVPFPISLSTAAPAGGLIVSLNSNDPLRVKFTPASVPIAAGQTQPASQPQVTGQQLGPVNVNVTAPGYGGASSTVQVSASLGLAPAAATVAIGATQNLTLTLSAPAPAGGVVVTVNSDSPSIASVPATVTIPQASTTATVPVTGVTAGVTVIRATGVNLSTATSTITVQGDAAIQMPPSLSVARGSFSPLSVRLSSPAPQSGVTIGLASSDPSKVTVSPTSVTIPGGQMQPTTQPQVNGVNFGSANISATASGFTSASTNVQVGAILSLTPQSLILAPGSSQPITVTVSTTAPAGGLLVNLQSNNASVASVPASVTIPANATSTTALVTGVSGGSATISASTAAPNVSGATATVTVQLVGAIILPTGTKVPLGQTVPFPVSLSLPAGTGGVTITLSSSNSSRVSITPSTVSIPAGQTQPSQQPQIKGNSLGTADISASAPGYASSTQSVAVTAALSFSPATLTLSGGETRNLTLNLSAPAPAGGVSISLTSNAASVATVPAAVSIAQGNSSVTVPVTGGSPGNAVIRATGTNVTEAVANISVVSGADIILPRGITVAPGEQAAFPIALGKPATDATFIDLSISDSSKATLSLQSVFIRAGQTEPSIQPRINGLAAGSITITARALGLNAATTSVEVGFGLAFVPPTLTIIGKATQNLTLSLTGPAPSTGLFVNLSSSNTGVATVPASVTIPPNSTTMSVPVTGVAPGSVVIRGTAANMADAVANVTVVNPGAISLPSGVSIQLGQTLPFAVTLSTPAPIGGVNVTLSSNNTSRLTVSPATVFVPAGQTQPATQPTISGVNVGPATVSASAPGYTPASQTVQVRATVTFTEPTLTLAPNTSGALLLKLSASAPWVDGVTVDLSSSNTNVATLQHTVTFYPDGSEFTTVFIPVQGLSPGTATIRASGLNIPEATAMVIVTGSLSITTTSLPNGLVGSLYSATLQANGGTPPLTWSLIAGTLPGGVALNASTGEVRGTPTASANATPLTFRVVDSAATPRSASATLPLTILQAQPTPASIAPNAGTPQSAPINTAFGQTLSAIVKDASGNPVSGATVTFTAPASGAGGTFAGGLVSTAATNSAGIATSGPFTANAIVGSYIVTARVPGVATPANFNLTNTQGAPASIAVVSGSPQSTRIKTAFGAPLKAIVKDATGTPLSGITVVFKLPAGPASATFANNINTATTDASGIATSQILTANSAVGPYAINAAVSGVTPDAVFSLTNTPGLPATITATGGTPQSAERGTTFASKLRATVKDEGGNVLSGVTVTFAAPGSGPSGTFAGGVTTAVTDGSGVATSADFTANSLVGSYQVTASVPGVAAAIFSLTNTAPPVGSIVAAGGTPQSVEVGSVFPTPFAVLVKDTSNTPVSGVTVTFTPPSSGASGAFAAGINTAVTNSSGIATSAAFRANLSPGDYFVVASVPGLAQTASFSLRNVDVPATPPVVIAGATVGQGLQTAVTVTLPDPAPVGGTLVTITSGDPTRLLIAGRPGDAGTASITVRISEGLTTIGGIYVQALAGSGTVQISASAPSLTTGNANVILVPAGFVATGPGGLGIAEFSVPVNLSATVNVISVRLDSASRPVETQQLRAGTSVTVPIANSTPSVGTLAAASVILNGGESSASTTFTAIKPGVTTLTAGIPSGFSAPSPRSVEARVPEIGMTPDTATVGQNLQTVTGIAFSAAVPPGGATMTITSNDSSKLLLSTTATAAGSTSIILNLQAGRTRTQDFYVHGLAGAGTASYIATATGFGPVTGFVNLRPSGFVISGPFGLGADFYTTPGAANSDLTIMPGMLDGSLNYVAQQSVRAGLNVSVNVRSSDTAVGDITNGTVTIAGGNNSAQTAFHPKAEGNTVLSALAPAGFSTPSSKASINASVRTPSLSLTNGIAIGRTLQAIGTVLLGEAAPVGGLAVTLTSNSGQLQLSSSATAAGNNSIVVIVPAGQSSAVYYLQALGDTGTASYTGSAPGYTPRTATVNLRPSGLIIAGPFGPGFPLSAQAGGPSQPVSVMMYQLEAGTNDPVTPQPLAGGRSVTVTLQPNGSATGNIPTSVSISGNNDTGIVQFTPRTAGTGSVGVIQPSGYSIPSRNISLLVNVQ